MPFAIPDPKINLDNHDFKDNEVLLFCPSYNTESGLYEGLKKKLEHITLRGDAMRDSLATATKKKTAKFYFVQVSNEFLKFFIALHSRNI